MNNRLPKIGVYISLIQMRIHTFLFLEKNFLLLMAFCSLASATHAQNSRFRSYSLEDGLPQSQVNDIVQDEIGYLWLGTHGGGLANFDGKKFTVWNEGSGLLSNYITALYAIGDTLFIGSRSGLSIKVKDDFLNFETPAIHQFFAWGKEYYLATDKGLYLYTRARGPQKIPIHPEIDKSSINSVKFDGTSFWFATNNGLWKSNGLDNPVVEKMKLETTRFTSVVLYDRTLFAATFDDGIWAIDLEDNKKAILIREPPRINSMAIHNENELWVATDNDGITIIDTQSYDEIRRLTAQNSLRVPHIRKTMTDSRSTLWIATSGGGFYKYFQNNFNHFDSGSGLKGNRTYAAHQADDALWVSSSEAGLTKIDSKGIQHTPQTDTFAPVKIKTITSDKQGNIWAGSDGLGILFRETKRVDSIVSSTIDSIVVPVDTISKTVIKNHVFNSENGFPSDWIRKLLIDDTHIWAATYSSGIIKFSYDSDADNLAIHRIFGKEDGLSDVQIRDIQLGPQGKLWYASQNGDLGFINNNQLTHLPAVLEQRIPINTLLFHQDQLYIGTAGKGIWYSEIGESLNFQKLKGKKKPTSENSHQLIFDNQGYLWVGTERGVSKIALGQENEIVDIQHFGRNDGFLAGETYLNAVVKDAEGNLWFGGMQGLTQYIPGETKVEEQKPKIRFSGLEIDHRVVDSIDANHWAKFNRVLRLTPEQTQLALSYQTVDLDHPDEIQYRTKLNGSEWGPWTSENRQNLIGLAYGSHELIVQSRNHRWQESDPIRFQFHRDSPLYLKPWFQWTMLLAALLGIIGISFYYIRKIKARNQSEQKQLQLQNHLLTLEQKALRLQMNPHFIFNVLNGIKAMGGQNAPKMNETINSFALLLRETLNNSRKDHIYLNQEIQTLRHYIEVEKIMAPKPFDYVITAETVPDVEELLIPPMLVQPFVENAIRHGILKGTGKGRLSLRFHTADNFLYCTITDNGPGIYQSQQTKAKTDHQSMALTVTRERLESLAGKDSLKITEIKNDGVVTGTRIELKLPVLTDY